MTSSPSDLEQEQYIEKGGKLDINAKLAEEVYGAGALSGEVDKFSSWGLKVRAFVGRFGAEEGGIERVPPEARTDQHPRDLFCFFSSGNCCITTLALGVLGPTTFELGWPDSVSALIVGCVIGSLGPGLLVSLGAKSGLRCMTIARFAFGLYAGGFIAFVNVLTCVGWSMVNTMAGAEAFYAMTNTKLPLAVCILILAIGSYIVGFLGYRWIHIYERYSWMVMYPFFAILAGFAGRYMQNLPIPASGQTEMADWMSFMATCLGYAVTWGPFSADYSVYMRENTGTVRLFCWTYFSLVTCQILIMALGAALATTIPGSPAFQAAFDTAGVGGLMDQSFQGYGSAAYGFGKFVQLVLVLSTIAVTIPNIYSLGLSMQNVGMWAVKVPRIIWTTIGFLVFTIAAIVGRDHFATILENFLNCLAYWVVPWTVIVALENWWFRRGGRNPYNFDLWWSVKGLPWGIAATSAWACSVILAIMSMSQVWYVGPIAIAAGGSPYGVDLGWCNSLGLALILYPPFRYIELKYVGR